MDITLHEVKGKITFVMKIFNSNTITMVNTEEFTKRLQKIMDFYELSAASFADKIDVGRSSISHLLSGRNKPSLDFVMKILQNFPEVELYWLLNGKGNFPVNPKTNLDSATLQKDFNKKPADLFSQDVENIPQKTNFSNSDRKTIQKIVIFYPDGTFEAYEN